MLVLRPPPKRLLSDSIRSPLSYQIVTRASIGLLLSSLGERRRGQKDRVPWVKGAGASDLNYRSAISTVRPLLAAWAAFISPSLPATRSGNRIGPSTL